MLTVCVKVFSKYCGGVNRHMSANTNSSDNLLDQRIPLLSHLLLIFKNDLILPYTAIFVFYVTKIALKYLSVLADGLFCSRATFITVFTGREWNCRCVYGRWSLFQMRGIISQWNLNTVFIFFTFFIKYFLWNSIFPHELLIAVIRYFLGHNNVIDTS